MNDPSNPSVPPSNASSSGGHAALAVPRIVGRYALYGEIARGGMATVHFGRLLGPVGFSRTVAIKRLHPQYAVDPEFVSMFLDEARLAARIRHPNVVSTLDVVALDGELMLVMEYVQGESLSRLLATGRAKGERVPLPIVVSIVTTLLGGLHAAHEAKSERGEPLGIVHRDISPQNALVGVDGVTRVLDFGIAKAAGRVQTTREGQFKGKLAYVAPEQLKGEAIDRRTDVYAVSVMLWEILTLQRLFKGDTEWEVMNRVMNSAIVAPSTHAPELSKELDELVMRGLAADPRDRFATAREMAIALERVAPQASTREVAEFVEHVAGDALKKRAQQVEEIETSSHSISAMDSGVRDLASFLPTTSASGRPLPRSSMPPAILGEITPSSTSAERPLASSIPPTIGESSLATLPTADVVVPRRSSVRSVWILLGLLWFVAGSIYLGARAMRAHDAPSEQAPAAAHSSTSTSSKATTPLLAATIEPTIAAPTATPAPSATTSAPTTASTPLWWSKGLAKSATPSASISAATPPSSATTSTPSAPVPTATTTGGGCNPPYTLDAKGIRHPKPDCL